MSYRRRQEVSLLNQGLVHVEAHNEDEGGSNRGGKSAIIEALVWCFFKKTIRGLRHSAVVNRSAKHGCYADARFHSAGIPYRIYRSQKRKGKVRVWANGKEQTFKKPENTQAYIEKILGCDFSSFTNSVVFGGVRPFAALSDAEQKKVLESFLHFEQLDAALRRTKERLTSVDSELQVQLTRKAKLDGILESHQTTLKAVKENERAWKEQHHSERRKIEKKLKALPRPVDFSEDLKRANIWFSAVDKRLAAVTGRVSEIREVIDCQGKPCPTCGQKVRSHSLSHLKAELKDKRREMERLERKEVKARKKLKHAQHKQEKADSQRELREELEGQLKGMDKVQKSLFTEQLESSQLLRSKALAKLVKTELKIKNLHQQERDLKFWVQGFGNQGVKSLIVRKALPAMNTKLKEFSKEIFEGKAELKFSPVKTTKKGVEHELFNLEYTAKHGAESYLGESSGGRRRVDICVLLVFAWLSNLCNLLLVDELLDFLDEPGRDAVLRILSTLRGTVLCITHQRDLKTKLSGRVWTVVKRDGESRVEVN